MPKCDFQKYDYRIIKFVDYAILVVVYVKMT